MWREAPAESGFAKVGAHFRSGVDSLPDVGFAHRSAIAFGLLVWLCVPVFSASLLAASSTNEIAGGLTVRRSMRAAPHRLIVHPNGATVAADQTQRFEVTDAQGNAVAVHWNVSGIGCNGAACGSIDEHGVYQPPATIPRPGFVTVEGVLESDPNYSVLTEVRLEPKAAASTSVANPNPPNSGPMTVPATESGQSPKIAKSVPVRAAKMQPLPAPSIERRPASSRIELPALPKAVAAAPEVASQNIGSENAGRTNEVPSVPLPRALTAAPVIGSPHVVQSSDLPLPDAVAAPPQVASRLSARGSDAPPLPAPVSAAPAVVRPSVQRSTALPLLPGVVAPAPAAMVATKVQKPQANAAAATASTPAQSAKPTATPNTGATTQVTAAAPLPAKTKHKKSEEVSALQLEVGAPPVIGRQDISRFTNLSPMPRAVSAAPQVADARAARASIPEPVPQLVASASLAPAVVPSIVPSAPVASTSIPSTSKPRAITSSAVVPPASQQSSDARIDMARAEQARTPARKPALPQMQDVISATSGTAASAHNGSVVSYANGQLRIDAENLSLAAVLKLVAQKTGAVIEVPPGSGTDPIFEHIGPGRPEDVLAALLNGSPFDYVIVGSPERPHEPAEVLLSLRGTTPAVTEPTEVAAETRPEPDASAYLFTPSPRPFITPPPSVSTSPAADSSATVTPIVAQPAAAPASNEPLSPDAREQMMRAYTRQLHGQSSQ